MLGRLWILVRLRHHLRLIWRLLTDRRVPLLVKLPVPLAALYVLSPIDLAPDFFPLLGQLDDLTVLFLASMLFLKLCSPAVVREHLEVMAGRPRQQEQPKGKVVEGEYRILK